MTTLLGDSSGLGYGVPAGRPVMTFVDEVAGMEVEWTLGVALSLVDPALLMRKVRRLTRPAEREREGERERGHGGGVDAGRGALARRPCAADAQGEAAHPPRRER